MEEDELSEFRKTSDVEDHDGPSFGQLKGCRKKITELFQCMQEELSSDLLDELKIACGDLPVGHSVEGSVLRKKSLNEIFSWLFQHLDYDVRSLFLKMAERFLTIVKDCPRQKELEELRDTIERENETFKLERENALHGRENEMKILFESTDFDAKESKHLRVINVCGMTGIGKSCLVKHFGFRCLDREDIRVIYVDASGVKSIADLEYEMLRSTSESPSEAHEVLGTFISHLQKDTTARYVLLLDDLSPIMPESDSKSLCEMLSWLRKFTKRMKELSIKLKLVVTSQRSFVTSTEKDQSSWLVTSMNDMKPYTKDIPLKRLKEADALKFLQSTRRPMNEEDKAYLVDRCYGHPLLLHTLEQMANWDFTLTTDIISVSEKDVQAHTMEAADNLFPKLFNRLDDQQVLLLFAVAMFDGNAALKALSYIVNPENNLNTFSEQVKKQFSGSFWVTFLSERDEDRQRKLLVRLHHPLIKTFIQQKIEEEMERDNDRSTELVEIKKRFITYNLREMIRVGRLCMSSKHLSRATSIFIDGQANFRRAVISSMEAGDPSLLFVDGSKLIECSEIAHLFVFFHLYHDWFQGSLNQAMHRLVNISVDDVCVKVLMKSLYVMVLAIQKDWRRLDDVLKGDLRGSKPVVLQDDDKELTQLCEAIDGYAAGCLYTHAPFYKERKDSELLERRYRVLNDAVARLNVKNGSSLWDGVKQYFSVHCLLLLAEAEWLVNKRDIPTIRKAATFCEQAKNLINKDTMLMPVVLTELAAYKAIEGDQFTQVEPAAKMYDEAKALHEDVIGLFKDRAMEGTSAAARNLNAYAALMRSYANLLTEHDPVPEHYREKALNCLQIAVTSAERAIKIFRKLSSCSKQELLKYYLDMADSCERLQYETPHSEPDIKRACQSKALENYREAFQLIKKHHRVCNLSTEDHKLKRLMKRLPELMKMHGAKSEDIDKVSFTLQRVRKDARKEEEERMDMARSGYERSSSSEDESDDESEVETEHELPTSGSPEQNDAAMELDVTRSDVVEEAPTTSKRRRE